MDDVTQQNAALVEQAAAAAASLQDQAGNLVEAVGVFKTAGNKSGVQVRKTAPQEALPRQPRLPQKSHPVAQPKPQKVLVDATAPVAKGDWEEF